jgi:hypothetical protein
MRRHSMMIVLTAALAPLPATCRAQVVRGAAPESEGLARHVIVQGGQSLASTVLNMVAQSVRPRLPDWPEIAEGDLAFANVAFIGEPAVLSEDSRIYLLHINYRRDLKLSAAQARDLWNVARDELESELRRVQAIGRESQTLQLAQALEELTAQQHELDAVSQRLREELAARRADSIGSETTLGQGLAEALSDQRKLKLEDAGNRARRAAVEGRIDQLREEAEASSSDDPILKELEKLVDIREQQVATVQALNNVGREADASLRRAEGELAEARIALLTARRDAEERAGGGALRELNHELSRLMVQAAEIGGRQKELVTMIENFRTELHKSVQAHAEAERLQQELETVRQRRSHIDARWFEKQRERAELPQSEISLRPLEPDEKNSKPPQ